MVSVAVDLLFVPVVLWAALGLSLLLTVRRSASSLIFRLTAVFLGLWAVMATSATLWVVTNGDWSAVRRLAEAPTVLFQPEYAGVWLAGAVGAFVVFLAAFLLSQAVGRGFLRVYPSREMPWPAGLVAPSGRVQLRVVRSDTVMAFAFTLLEHDRRLRFRRNDFVLVSDQLLKVLKPLEWEAVLAHEIGHLRELDGRYLTFFRTLARMMRWDPVFAYFADVLTRREEYRADLDAVEITLRPRALARALYKATSLSSPPLASLPSLLGVGGRRGRREAMARIRRLVALAESGEFPEESGG